MVWSVYLVPYNIQSAWTKYSYSGPLDYTPHFIEIPIQGYFPSKHCEYSYVVSRSQPAIVTALKRPSITVAVNRSELNAKVSTFFFCYGSASTKDGQGAITNLFAAMVRGSRDQ